MRTAALRLGFAAWAVLVVAHAAAFPPASQPGPATRRMALTFDDLPYVAVGNDDLGKARRTTMALLRALKSRRAPAVGFVNEAKLTTKGEEDARVGLLREWVEAGMILGNHTYSHADFNLTTVEGFQEEILRGEVVTRRLMAAREPYPLFFRHPMTHTGDTSEKKKAIEAFLAARGYAVAPHTVDSVDFLFNVAYARARDARDEDTAKRLREAYLDFVVRATEFAEGAAPRIFGHDIPQTMLLHANDLNADCLEELLRRLEARGYRFVALAEAMSDPAYRTTDSFTTRFGPSWLWRWARSMSLDISFADDPEPPAWVTDLSEGRATWQSR